MILGNIEVCNVEWYWNLANDLFFNVDWNFFDFIFDDWFK